MQTNNSSNPLEGEASRRSLFVVAINVLMVAVVLALLFNLPALFVLLRAAIRRKIISPFLINMCVVSVILSTFGDCVILVIHSTTALAAEDSSFLCTWLGFVKLLCIQAYASTLFVSNSMYYFAVVRASRGLPERLTRKSNAWVLLALWFYCLVLTIPSTGLDLFTTSPSQFTCEPRWSSTVPSHIIYNCFLFITLLVAPLAMCLVVQLQFQRYGTFYGLFFSSASNEISALAKNMEHEKRIACRNSATQEKLLSNMTFSTGKRITASTSSSFDENSANAPGIFLTVTSRLRHLESKCA